MIKKKTKALIWFTKDLRIHDNPVLAWAQANAAEIIGLLFEDTVASSLNTDFYFHSALELQKKFKEKGLYLSILKGKPSKEIPIWMKSNDVDIVLTQDSFNSRDRDELTKLEEILSPGQLKIFYGQTLIEPSQLPYEISKLPLVFTEFRKKVEASAIIQEPLFTTLEFLEGFNPQVPGDARLKEMNILDMRLEYPFDLLPGESNGLKRVEDFFLGTQSIEHYKKTRNGMIQKDQSSKFSLYLSCGCLSPRLIYSKLKNYEETYGENESTKWFFYELLWRDYFKFLALKIGRKLFSINGLSSNPKSWEQNDQEFQKWCSGETGADFIDANMIELNQTGWMSNRGRQNVASYLAKTMKIDWTLGAHYFEQMLIDFDTESNWGNWIYVAGVGTDPRDRIFNYKRQAEMYDSDFSYRKMWLPQNRSASKAGES